MRNTVDDPLGDYADAVAELEEERTNASYWELWRVDSVAANGRTYFSVGTTPSRDEFVEFADEQPEAAREVLFELLPQVNAHLGTHWDLGRGGAVLRRPPPPPLHRLPAAGRLMLRREATDLVQEHAERDEDS